MARFTLYRTQVASYTGTGIVTIADNQLPATYGGGYLVGIAYNLVSTNGTAAPVTDITRVRLRTQSDTFYDQLVVHERLFQERFGYRGYPTLATAGQSNATLTNGGGFVIWLNDQRAMTPDLQDTMGPPIGEGIVHEITVGTYTPAAQVNINIVGIYSTVRPTRLVHRTSFVLNAAPSTTNASRNIDEAGRILAYGVPNVSATTTAAFSRLRFRLGAMDISDGNPALHFQTELDEAPWSLTGALANTAGATTVWWKSTRGIELPGAGGNGVVTIDTGTFASWASVELPIFAYLPQRA